MAAIETASTALSTHARGLTETDTEGILGHSSKEFEAQHAAGMILQLVLGDTVKC